MRTLDQLAEWCDGAREQFGDPAVAVCQIFARYVGDVRAYEGNEIVCGFDDGEFILRLGILPIPLMIADEPEISPDGELDAFGAEMISLGVWALTPSLNMQGMIHAFVVLYDVPTPVPWQRLIVLAG